MKPTLPRRTREASISTLHLLQLLKSLLRVLGLDSGEDLVAGDALHLPRFQVGEAK
jgi:hypothetical protein